MSRARALGGSALGLRHERPAAAAERQPGRRMRVLQFATSLQVGGTERQLVALIRGLDRSRFEPRLGCLRLGGELLDTLADDLPRSEYPISSLFDPRSLAQRLRLARDLRTQRIDLVHCHGFYANVFAIPAAWLARVPVILASVRDSAGGILWTAAQQRAQRAICRMADGVLVNAQAVGDVLAGTGYDPAKLHVVFNGVEMLPPPSADPGRVRRELGLPAGAPLVATVTRLERAAGVEFKGIGCFLDAVARLARRHPDARYLIVGDGHCRAELESRSKALGLEQVVLFTGVRRDIPDILRELSVSVLPSLTEGLSNSLLEAMACGVPVVATRVGGTPEVVVDNECGLLVPAGDASTLAEAIDRLLVDPPLRARLSNAALQRVAERFSMSRMVQDTENLYETMVARCSLGPALREAKERR
jgi:glycosyltransferase involved in cell wall biosynthesis